MENKCLSPGHSYWRPEAKISAKDCKSIIELYENSPQEGAETGLGANTDVRSGTVNFHNQQGVYDLIWPYMQGANIGAEWNFEISAAEDYQISKYEVGDFYSTHMDCLGTNSTKWIQNDNSILHNKTRKISMSLILNDDYEGGELILFDVGAMKQEVGTMIFFPSFLPHEVTPVTKGTRYSLVMWFLGTPWR